MINPNIWEDPSFNKLSHSARILFIGLISNADDEGYLRADPASLKRLIFGFDEITIASVKQLLSECEKHIKSLHFYGSSENEEFCHFINWNRYQKQQKDRILDTLYPMCSKCVASVKQLRGKVEEVVKVDKEAFLNKSSRETLKENIDKIIKKKTI